MSYLIERVTYYVTNNKGTCNIFISTRNENNKSKNAYLKNELMNKRKYHHILIKCIKNINFFDNRDRNLLQLADVCCSSFAQAIKYNDEQEWEYVIKLKSNIWMYKGLIVGYGIKFYPPIDWFKIFPNIIHLTT